MNYLLDRRNKQKKVWGIVAAIVLLFVLFFFKTSVFYGLSYISHTMFRPVLVLGNGAGNNLKSLSSLFYSKKSLLTENENLKRELAEMSAKMANYNSLFSENILLKEAFGRVGLENQANMVLAGILSKPNKSLYDTLLIDAGTDEGLQIGNRVFALGNVPIGRVAEVFKN